MMKRLNIRIEEIRESSTSSGGAFNAVVFVIIAIAILTLCSRRSSSKVSGAAIDFGGDKYPTMVVNRVMWMKKDLALVWPNSHCPGISNQCNTRYYSWKIADKACRNAGGKLPTVSDWKNAASALLVDVDRNIPLNATHYYAALSGNMNLKPKGYMDTVSGSVIDRFKKSYYWTSEGYVVVFNTATKTMTYERPNNSESLFPCRCIRKK